MNVNFGASLWLIQKFAPAMQRNRWGRILTIGSVQQRRPHPDMVVYAASKSAQENLVRNLAKQLGRDGIINYLDTIEYRDKAGSYAFQEQGGLIVDRFRGSATNIIGFPLRLFFSMLGELGVLDRVLRLKIY